MLLTADQLADLTGYRRFSAKERLGHQSATMTQRVYRRGQKVTPLR